MHSHGMHSNWYILVITYYTAHTGRTMYATNNNWGHDHRETMHAINPGYLNMIKYHHRDHTCFVADFNISIQKSSHFQWEYCRSTNLSFWGWNSFNLLAWFPWNQSVFFQSLAAGACNRHGLVTGGVLRYFRRKTVDEVAVAVDGDQWQSMRTQLSVDQVSDATHGKSAPTGDISALWKAVTSGYSYWQATDKPTFFNIQREFDRTPPELNSAWGLIIVLYARL